jgi:hypothetical protein
MATNHYRNHNHTTNLQAKLRARPAPSYAAVVGTVDLSTEKDIMGRSGDHLQFYVNIGGNLRYQADINTQSKDGSEVLVYVADETLDASENNPPFGFPAYGVFPAPDTKLSYKALGLQENQFAATSDTRVEAQLEATLGQSEFVAIYGFVFDDGGDDGKGIHETHLNPGKVGEDGAVAVFIQPDDGKPPIRRWFFFKFQGENIA